MIVKKKSLVKNMSKMSKTTREKVRKNIGNQQRYISRITKTLYYGKFPKTDSLSLPVTELAAELFSETQRGRSIDRLHCSDAANISRNACVSPCSLVLAILYLEKLKRMNPEYLEKTSPVDVFLVSLMVSCKYLYDDGQIDEVFVDEWAKSAGIPIKQLVDLEKNFLKAIDWQLYVDDLMFWKKLEDIEEILAKRQGRSRGYYTYTELQNLLKTVDINNIVQNFAVIFTLMTASYMAALLTLVSSIWIVSYIPGTSMHLRKTDSQPENLPQNETFLPTPTVQNLSENELDTLELNILEMKNANKGVTLFLEEDEDSVESKFHSSKDNFFLCNEYDPANCQVNVQNITSDWWSVPIMKWLPQVSEMTDFSILKIDYLHNFLETLLTAAKYLSLEDQVHKASKMRIQDQLEKKWHKEWIETINYKLGRQSYRSV